MRRVSSVALGIVFLLQVTAANAEIVIETGPTSIPRGDATGAADITIRNQFFAIAIAVDTAPPWGVARGGILDIALITDGETGFDIASLADFMPNRWSSWPTSYQRVTVEKASTHEAIVKTVRDWGQVELETVFYVKDDDSKIRMRTRMTNNGDTALDGLLSGYVVWPDGGSLFGVPGLGGLYTSTEDNALADWSASYSENWVLGLHAPFAEYADFGGRDRYLPHDLQAGESKTFEAWLQIEHGGSLAPLVRADIEIRNAPSGRIAGHVVSDHGEPVGRPAVVVSKDGRPYAWTVGRDGNYQIDLPAGDYEVYATARGYTQSPTRRVSVSRDSETRLDFDDVRPPGAISVRVADADTGQALDARISIVSGHKPLIGYLGKNRFFTQLDAVGEITETIAAGSYVLEVSSGGGFTSTPQLIDVVVESGRTHEVQANIAITAKPQERGWYSADLHHHSDILDGFTEAEFVLRSELAAGVDIAFLSDHDSVTNNATMQELSDARGRFFIPGTELSPSWAHFNAYPLDDGKTVSIDTGQATVQQLFKEARRMGADVIEVNHPYSGYGYFQSLETGEVPGGYDTAFDLVEIEGDNDAGNAKTIEWVWRMWNEGHEAYLAGGSDVHDVWLQDSGSARTFVHVDGALGVEKFVQGLKAGHAFTTQGPLVYPDILFGSELQHPAGEELALTYSIEAVSGLSSVQLIERGSEIELTSFDGTNQPVAVGFSVRPESDTWYSLVVKDANGKSAYTNPVWVSVTQPAAGPSLLALILTVAMAITLLTASLFVLRWPTLRCTGPMSVSFFTFIAILFTSGLDVGLIMFPLVDFQVYATERAYAFANPLAIEFGFWGFLVWAFYFLTTFYFCIIEPKLKLFQIPVIRLTNNIVIVGTCAFTAYLFLLYLPDYIQGIGDPFRYALVAIVVLCATVSSTDIKFVKVLSVSSTWLFFALIVGAWLASGMGVSGLARSMSGIGAYFSNIHRFLSPITEYHQFYLYWWFAWSIMIGQFVARFVGGLKAWQLLLALLVVPSIPIAIWFSVLYYYFSGGLEIGPYWRLAMVIVGVIFVINSLDSLIRLYTQNLGLTTQRIGKLHYVAGNWIALCGLVVLYKFTPLKIEWIGLVVVGIYAAIYLLVFQRRRQLIQPPA